MPIWDQYVDFMEWSLNSLANIFQNGGLGIIAFTIIIKTILLPFTVKSIRSSKAMQELGPKIKEIQKKHGKDRQKVSQETFALYNQHGVNPMASCLPMLIQIPIFFGLYRAISNLSVSNTGHWTDGFLWLQHLNEADPWKILPILAGLFQFIQSRMMRPAGIKVTDPQQQLMNQMMNFMPLMVVIFGWTFASGPVLYWATQSIYSVVQQWFITGWGNMKEWFPWLPEMPEHRRLGYRPPRPIEDVVVMSGAGAGVVGEQKGFQGWLAKRMAEAQENAQARQETLREQREGKSGGATGKGSGTRSRTTTTATDGDVIETTGGTTSNAKPGRKSSSYQDRVDAATKFGAKTTRSGSASSNGNGAGSASGSAPRPTAVTVTASGASGSTAPRRKVKRRRSASS
ncbi:MAG: YidC/Oxa1 family membrane protein insertase [Chloroflexia bacterium]|nr:YidC/Oxa1 family membrane protein insertase [Chloroflexia bacterium]